MHAERLVLLLLAVSAAGPAAAVTSDYNVKVKAPNSTFSIHIQGGYLWVQGWQCDLTSFQPQSPPAVISPRSNDPRHNSPSFTQDLCWGALFSNGQVGARFYVQFNSLTDLGVNFTQTGALTFDSSKP